MAPVNHALSQPIASTADLRSIQKAALVLIAMGVDNAGAVMKELDEKEIEKVSVEITLMKNIPAEVLSEVIEEFYQIMQANQFIVQGGMNYASNILEAAYGKKRANEILKRVEATTEVSAFYLLQTVDDKQLLNFLQNEHPQTAALILANLKAAQAASILSELPQENQSEIAYRLATMEKTSPELIEEIEDVLREQIGTVFGGDLSATGGAEAVADILNSTTRSAEKNILDSLKERDADLFDEIASLMFLFEDINLLPDAAVQAVVKNVDSNTMALALKATSEDLKEKIFRNMSERAADMLKDELQYLGPVRVRDVENSQKEILDVVRQLESDGEIVISRGEEEEVID